MGVRALLALRGRRRFMERAQRGARSHRHFTFDCGSGRVGPGVEKLLKILDDAVIFTRSNHIQYFDQNLKARNSTVSDAQNALFSLMDRLDDAEWRNLVNELKSAIHPVDQRATYIWFAFFP